MTSFPRRFRLHGGRTTHAARPLNSSGYLTRCGYDLPETGNHALPDNAPITCRACNRLLNRES